MSNCFGQDASKIESAGGQAKVMKIDSTSETHAAKAVEEIEFQGITHIDTVIGNAGLGSYWGSALETPASVMVDYYKVNALGLFILFQGMWPCEIQLDRSGYLARESAMALWFV